MSETARKAYTGAELDIDYCGNVYGVYPCRAAAQDVFRSADNAGWNFDNNSLFSWVAANASLTATDDGMVATQTGADMYITGPGGLGLPGALNHVLMVDYEMVSGSGSWDGTVYLPASSGGYYSKTAALPNLLAGQRRKVYIDVSDATPILGATLAYPAATISQVRLDLGGSAGRVVKLHAVALGYYASNGPAWVMNNSNQGFTASAATLTPASGGSVYDTGVSNDANLYSPIVTINGASNRYVTIEATRTTNRTGSAAWEGRLYYSTANHSYGAWLQAFSDMTLNVRTKVVLDMWALAFGGGDWKNSVITRLRFDFDNGVGSGNFIIHSITVGKSPGASNTLTGTERCFNCPATCQDRGNLWPEIVTLAFTEDTGFSEESGIPALPMIQKNGVNLVPAVVSLGENLGMRSTLTVRLRDRPHSDAGKGFDKYWKERGVNPWEVGTFFGKLRSRQPYLVNRGSLRLLRGYIGQTREEMDIYHHIVTNMNGPQTDGTFVIVGGDVLRLADRGKAQAPKASKGFLTVDISAGAGSFVLSPVGVGNADNYDPGGLLNIGGKEIISFSRDPYTGLNGNTQLLMHFNGSDGSTTMTDSSGNGRTGTVNGNAQLDNSAVKYGSASLYLDGVGDSVTFADNNAWTFAGDFTIDFWARFDGAIPNKCFFSHGTDANNEYRMFTHTDGSLRFQVVSGGTAIVSLIWNPAGEIRTGKWNHYAVVRYGNQWRLFYGNKHGSYMVAEQTAAVAIPNFAGTLKIGACFGTPLNFIGWYDEFRVQSQATWTTSSFGPPGEYNNQSPDYINIVARGVEGTLAVEHKAQDRVQTVLEYKAEDPADIMEDLFVIFAGVPKYEVPIDDWREETETYLQRSYSAIIADPTPVTQLASELIQQAALAVWHDAKADVIRFQVLRGILTDATLFSPDNRLHSQIEIKEQPDKRVSQVWSYYGKKNPLESNDKPENYRSVAVTIRAEIESEYGVPAVRKQFCRWIPEFGRPIAQRLNEIILGRFERPPRLFSVKVLARPGVDMVELGQGARIVSPELQLANGTLENIPIQITEHIPDTDILTYVGEEMRFNVSPDFNERAVIIDADTFNFNARTAYDSLFPTPMSGDEILFIVSEGVRVGSTNISIPAFDMGSWPAGVIITVRNKGRILGKAGNGGNGGWYKGITVGLGPGMPGTNGGPAFYTRTPIILEGGGIIGGGGGGGGGGGFNVTDGAAGKAYGGGGGGGGQGHVGGNGGARGEATLSNGGPGQAGTSDNPGNGGGSTGGAGQGGTGGSLGQNGNNGGGSNNGNGGAAGPAVNGDSYVTNNSTVTFYGTRTN